MSASLKAGTVTNVTITSEAGLNCSILSPWVGTEGAPSVTRAGKSVDVARVAGPGQLVLWRFATERGATYQVAAPESVRRSE